MEYEDNLFSTSLPTMQINRKDINSGTYKQIGYGGEGTIYKYNDSIAFKTFDIFPNRYLLDKKFQKIELLAKLKDESFCFPIGLLGYENAKKEGYYTNLVKYNRKRKDFTYLDFEYDYTKLIEYLVKADAAMQRIHKKGVIIGDIRGENIMIDQNDNPIFVDTDNYAYDDYDVDLPDIRLKWLSMAFLRKFSAVDNDKYVFAMMALQYFMEHYTIISHHQKDSYFKALINNLNVDAETKDGLREIFSDTDNKPYIGPILQRMKTKGPIISKPVATKVNRL